MGGQFVISLDFELLWGVRDHADRQSYGKNVLGARAAVPAMLDCFADHGLRATWATVGFLFCEDRDDLVAHLPAPQDRPAYRNPALSSYAYLDELGADEDADPYYFAPSLVARIQDTPGQEIGTHTLSHCYCLEEGMTPAAFEADIVLARQLAERRGITLRSIVFPRNQFAPAYLEVCARQGLTHYRGNPAGHAYRAVSGAGQTRLRRALRLADAYTGVLGPHDFDPAKTPPDVAASRFLRPCAGRLAVLHDRHIATILREMTRAAERGTGYHLWWHPHNFGLGLEANMAGLRRIAAHFAALGDSHGMVSRAMGDFGKGAPA